MKITIQRDGLTLRGILTTPQAPTFNLAILMHGFTSDCGRQPDQLLYQLAQRLAEAGLATLRVDFNGHGESDGAFKDMTVLNEISDGHAILAYAQRLPGVRHIYLVGHSQGGVVASMLVGYYPDVVSQVTLLAPAATLKDDALKGDTQGYSYDPHHIPEQLPIKKGLTLGGFYLRTAQTLPIYEIAQRYQGPVLLVHGLADQVVDPIASKRYEQVYRSAQLQLLPHADHGFTSATVRETVLRLVTGALADPLI
ncbi:alpha/beta hydrolase [Lactiplantibacillus modestisalitolerans]|uniref:Alpha/beta hydrolase n=1 Tax=Lactiplantibacillus modestisalitolerans TaxID=1457219 RepID=A0ABV5WWY0_9LACO|nr:alpha/beta fold hydrolase [Lactiplantibacillus modestisalitolerans]